MSRSCEFCGAPLVRGRYSSGNPERPANLAKRRFCDKACATRARRKPFESWFAPDPETGCWVWHGVRSDAGYGTYTPFGGVTKLAHRITYERHIGPIPEGLELDHLCRNRACCNPSHLEAVSHGENIRRSPLAKLTHADVAEIRRRCKAGETTHALGDAFGLHPSHISRIARGLAWGEGVA